jgi:hypothetical protein
MKTWIIITLLTTGYCFNSNLLQCQEWYWEWASTCTKNGKDGYSSALHTNFTNHAYCRTMYDSAIYFPDTVFIHPNYANNSNSAISKYDSRGNFINALDLLTHGFIQSPRIVTDSLMNVYLAAPFRVGVFIKDAYLTISPTSNPNQPDIFIAKLTPEYDLIWSGLISSYNQDELHGMVISEDNYIYISSAHMPNQTGGQVNYLDQDSSAISNTPMMSVIKIDLDGNLIWKKEIKCPYLGNSGRQFYIGENGLIYFLGRSYGDLIIGNDTIIHPYLSEVKLMHYMTVFNPSGEFLHGFFFDWDIWLWETQTNSSGDIFIWGSIQDTAVIGTDTIVVPPGETYVVAGRFTPQLEPVWYQIGIGASFFRIFLDEDNLLFVGSTGGIVQIGDTTFNLGNQNQITAGEFSADGALINFLASQCSGNMFTFYSTLDNCMNLIIGGGFKGTSVFGSDTITSQYLNVSDGFVAKLIRNAPGEISLGNDTTVCDEYVITAPEGFKYYQWNDSLMQQNWYKVTESGVYTFACANDDGCWLYDTIHVTIDPLFEISLGPDTTLFLSDTLILSIPHGYDSYLWFNGSTENSILIIGSESGTGVIEAWATVTNGTCVVTDTVWITIKDPFGIDLITDQQISLSPNPFRTSVSIELKPGYKRIEIYDINGVVQFEYNIEDPLQPKALLELGSLENGVYLLKVISTEQVLSGKLIKI